MCLLSCSRLTLRYALRYSVVVSLSATTSSLGIASLGRLASARYPKSSSSARIASLGNWLECRINRKCEVQTPLILLSNATIRSSTIQSPQQPQSHVLHSHPLGCWLISRLHSTVRWTAERRPLETRSIPKSPLSDSFAPQLSILPPATSPPVTIPNGNSMSLEQQLRTSIRRHGPSRVDGTKRLTWKTFLWGPALLVGAVWLFMPRTHTFLWRGNGNADLYAEGYQTDTAPSPSKTHHQHTQQQQHPSVPPTKPPITHPDSGPEPSSTTHCTHPPLLLFRHSRANDRRRLNRDHQGFLAP